MKIRLWCDNGANIHSKRVDVLGLENDLGLSLEAWRAMSEDEKYEIAKEWAMERFDYGYEELP